MEDHFNSPSLKEITMLLVAKQNRGPLRTTYGFFAVLGLAFLLNTSVSTPANAESMKDRRHAINDARRADRLKAVQDQTDDTASTDSGNTTDGTDSTDSGTTTDGTASTDTGTTTDGTASTDTGTTTDGTASTDSDNTTDETASTGTTTDDTASTDVEVPAPTLTWLAPTTREDGSSFYAGEVQGYRLYYRSVDGTEINTITIDDGTLTSFSLDSLAPGMYEFTMAAVDTNGTEGELSNAVLVDNT